MLPTRAPSLPSAASALAALSLLLLAACGTVPTDPTGGTSSTASSAASSSTSPGAGAGAGDESAAPDQSGPSDSACEYTVTGTPARPVQPPSTTDISSSGTVTYVMKLSEGDVTLKLDRAKAPCTVHSFESLVTQKYYDKTRCHRLVDSGIFVLQCGDPTATGSGGPGYTFPDETDGTEKYTRGTLAMANAGPNTNGSQFFLVWDDSQQLPPDYTVFGSFDEKSREVVAGIASQGQDGSNPDGSGVPISKAEIESITKAS